MDLTSEFSQTTNQSMVSAAGDPNKIEANLNFGMCIAKQQHCVIHPQILPNLLEHSQKQQLDINKPDVDENISKKRDIVIGTLLGTQRDKIIDISNSFPINHKFVAKTKSGQEISGDQKSSSGQRDLSLDTDYVTKMLKFYRQVNNSENLLGVYISSTVMNQDCMVIVQYFVNLLKNKAVKSPLLTPIVLLFDPELRNDRLDIKVLNLHSSYLHDCPLFSELPFSFNVTHYDRSGLDVLFYGQEHFDTMAIIEDKKDMDIETIGNMLKNQKILGNREVMLKNFQKLVESLNECEDYIQKVADGNQENSSEIGQMINQCMSQFQDSEMSILEQMILANFKDAMMTNNISKLQISQVNLSSKINEIFSQSLNQYILHQNSKFKNKQDNIVKPAGDKMSKITK